MNKQENCEADSQSLIEDLTVNRDQAEVIKGGPIVVKEVTFRPAL